MKKFLTFLMILPILIGTMSITAFAQTAEEISVYVTISDEDGKLALTQEKIAVTDIDNDDLLTINDALYVAHEKKYKGGATAGFDSELSDYGISLNKLWGTANGGSYGYCVNNKSAFSLSDTVNHGDYINAYIYTDLTAWSDTYCYFDMNATSVNAGDEINLSLLATGYDSEYNPIVIPVENAVITVNGEKTSTTTDTEGKATIKIKNSGEYVISAVSDTQILVPPVCKATVTGNNVITTVPSTSATAIQSEDTTSLKTGENTNAVTCVFAVIGLSLIVISMLTDKRKNDYEK